VPKPDIHANMARVAIEGEWGPETWATVFYLAWQGTMDATFADAVDLADQITTAVEPLYTDGLMPTNVHTSRAKLKLFDASLNLYRVNFPLDWSGSGTADVTDAGQACYLINWQTGDPRRGGKCRWYLPGVHDEVLANQARINPASVTSYNAKIATALADLKAMTAPWFDNPQLVEASFVDGGADRISVVSYEVVNGTLNPVIASQRRRVDRLRQ